MVPPPADAPTTRGHKKKERTRSQLISAAIAVIAEHGEGFGIRDITTHAGVSHGTFYNYFDDREALLDAVVPEALIAFADESADAVDDDDPAVRFATITALALHRAATTPEEIRVILRLTAVQDAIVAAPAFDHMRADIAAGAAAGRFITGPDGATLDVMAGGMLAAARRIVEEAVPADYAAEVVAHLLRSLGISNDEASKLADDATADARSHTPAV